jgi:hypothetical protein
MAERRIEPNFNQGWGVAIFIVLLAIGAFATAGWIKQTTFHDPRDPMPGGAATAQPAH